MKRERRTVNLFASIVVVFAVSICATGATAAPAILRTERVWDAAPHNSFTDLAWYKDRFVLAFREGPVHGVPTGNKRGGNLRILQSKNGLKWTSSALIEAGPNEDLRD